MEVLTLESFKNKIFDFETSKEWNFKGNVPTIIDFYADWCAPCRRLSPILEEVAKQYAGKVQIYKIDTEASPELASMFQIRSIPSLLFIPLNGTPAMSSGVLTEDGFAEAIEDLFKIPKPVTAE